MSIVNYLSTLDLKSEPFSTSPDPKFFYQSKEHHTALSRLEIAIRLKRGMSLILGDIGTGKTTLCRALLQNFNEEENDFIFHIILDPSFKSEYQFLAYLTKIFGISPFFRSTIDHREAIEKYLFKKGVEERKTIVLLIDEGQKLSQPQIEILRTLLNYETNEYKILQLVIFGQMELLPKIKRIPNFLDRISLKYMLNPLDLNETNELIEFRLKQAGYTKEKRLFSPEAVRRIYDYSGGYPRRTALLCHNAIEYLIADGYEMVSEDLINRIIEKEKCWD